VKKVPPPVVVACPPVKISGYTPADVSSCIENHSIFIFEKLSAALLT